MTITQIANDAYEISLCGGLRRIIRQAHDAVVRKAHDAGGCLTNREIRHFLEHVPVQLGVGERLVGQVMRRLGMRQTLKLLVDLAGTSYLLP